MEKIEVDAGKWVPDVLEQMYNKICSSKRKESITASMNGITVIMFQDKF